MATDLRSNPAAEKQNAAVWAAARAWHVGSDEWTHERDGRARHVCHPPESNLYIEGPNGAGKTFLARVLLQRAASCGHSVGEWNAAAFSARAMEFGFRLDAIGPDETPVWHRKARLLLVDDLDKGRWQFGALQALYAILDYRADSRPARRTIVTSNVPYAKVEKYMSTQCADNTSLARAIVDRLHPVRVWTMRGPSLRKV